MTPSAIPAVPPTLTARSNVEEATPRSRRGWVMSLGALTLAGVAGLGVRWGAADDRPGPGPGALRDVPRFAEGAIHHSAAYAERIGLRVEPVREHALAPVVDVTGTVRRSPSHTAAVGALIFGRVRDVHVVVGQEVDEGQPLATLESAELGRAQAELAAARARARLAGAEHRRKQQLVDEGIAAHRSVDVTGRELDAARAYLRASEQRVRAMVGSAGRDAALGELELRTPIAGEVIAANVVRGQPVEPEQVAFEVADLRHLWLELAVFTGDLPLIAEGDDVLVQPLADEARSVRGRVAHVGSVIDPVSRTATVRVEIDDAARALRVGQAVRARIVSRGAEVRALAVPRRAVVLVDGAPTVFVSPAEGQVLPRTVALGVHGPEHVEVREGLRPGERVVVDGVFELKSELFR